VQSFTLSVSVRIVANRANFFVLVLVLVVVLDLVLTKLVAARRAALYRRLAVGKLANFWSRASCRTAADWKSAIQQSWSSALRLGHKNELHQFADLQFLKSALDIRSKFVLKFF
jgi:hypothetical protein